MLRLWLFLTLGAFARIIGYKLGFGKEFEKGFMFLGVLSLSMIGMIVISPYPVQLPKPLLSFSASTFHVEPPYLIPVIVGKLTAGVFSVFAAVFIYRRVQGKEQSQADSGT